MALPLPSRGHGAALPRPLLGYRRRGVRYLVFRGVRCPLPELAVVVPLHCAPGFPVFEDV